MGNTRKNGIIVCAFPATGKTTFLTKAEDFGVTVCDSDSEDHHWVDRNLPREQRVERPNWVEKYINHLIQSSTKYDFVFASTHDVVRNALVAAGIPFVAVFPTADQKDDFIERVRNRNTGLHGDFGVNLITKMWDEWLEGMNMQTGCGKVVLQKNHYLCDVLEEIKEKEKLQPFGYLEKVPDVDAPVSDNPSGLYCPGCRKIGAAHCAHPEECGGMRRMKIASESVIES